MATDLLPAPVTAAPPDEAPERRHSRTSRTHDHPPDRRGSIRCAARCGLRVLGSRDPHTRCTARRWAVLLRRLRHHHRLPPVPRAQVVRCRPTPQARAHRRRVDGLRRWTDRVGCRPSPPSRLLRPRGRPALAQWHDDTAPRALARPRRLALQPRADVVGASCEGPHGRPRHRRHERALPDVVCRVARHPLRPRLDLGWQPVGRSHGSAVGWRSARLPRAPRDMERQLPLSCLRPATVRHDRPQHERRRTCPSSRWASRGTTAITRSLDRRATACSRISGIPRHAPFGASSSSAGPPTSTGRRRPRSHGVDPQPDRSSISADRARIRSATSSLHSIGNM